MKIILCCSCILFACASCQQTVKQHPGAMHVSATAPYANVDTLTYVLKWEDTSYRLKNTQTGKLYEIPKSQLKPPVEDEEQGPQLELTYGPRVTAVPAGKGLVCLQVSSYEIAKGGSMALAEGYDVFLLLDTAVNRLLPGVFHLGQTRGRYRSMGYFEATDTHFYISRPSSNEVCRIGIRTETINIDWNDETGTIAGGPYHDFGIIKWFRFDGANWIYDPKLDRLCPMGQGAGELPPSTAISPIEVALEAYRSRRF